MSQNEDTKPTEPLTGMKAFLAEIATTLDGLSEAVKGRYKEVRIERELTSRVELLDKAFTKLHEARKELQKMNPDIKNRDASGAPVTAWSNEAWDKKQKATEALAKLEKATEAAFEGRSFDELRKLVG